jgi:hypothetical protein
VGYYSAALDLADNADVGVASIPQGYGYVTFSVAAAGTLTVTGKTADGQTITSAGFVGPNGQIAVYTSLYGNLGSVLGKLTACEDDDGWFMDNEVHGTLSWQKPEMVTRAYAAGFGAVNLAVSGGYLAPDMKEEVLGLPEAGEADLLFAEGGVAASAIDPDVTGFGYTDENKVVLPVAGGANNEGKVTLVIAKGSGAVSGTFTLVETAPLALTRKVTFQGQVVRMSDGSVKAVGYFLLPQIPTTGQTAASSPIRSGAFSIVQ